MPRKPTRFRQQSKFQPLTFSPFGRSLARVSSSYSAKHPVQYSKLINKCFSGSKGDKVGHHHSLENETDLSQSSDVEESDGVIQADFAFFDPKPNDFHGVKVLLKTYIDDMEWDLSGFVDLILAQATVGTVIKIEGDEDDTPYSVVSALNLKRYKDHRCMKELKDYLFKLCSETNVLAKMSSLLGEQSQNVGLLVSQRVVNLPPQLLPPLYDALFDEITWATEDEPTEELRKSFLFKHYLLVTRIYELKSSSQKLKRASSSCEEPIIYIKPEDELFHKLSSWSFKFPLGTQQLPTRELRNYRLMGLVMTLEAEKVPEFRQQLHALINES